jgi:hypothetical protein
MNITYSYQIISVDEAARCMEVVYTAEGHQTMHIGARLPYEGETLESVIEQFAPVAYWQELQRPVLVPQVGTTGVMAPAPAVTENLIVQSSSDIAFAQIFPTPPSGAIDGTVLN